eukprot:1158779-Pelagomonas_calceolata.AAC.3
MACAHTFTGCHQVGRCHDDLQERLLLSLLEQKLHRIAHELQHKKGSLRNSSFKPACGTHRFKRANEHELKKNAQCWQNTFGST